jgi:acyl-CoA thioester hydrolase
MIWDETAITVRFNEVDVYQVAWHGHYVSWMEVGRLALARRFGLDPFQLTELGYLGPVVQLELKYLRPARCNDALTVCTTLEPSEAANLIFVSQIIGPDGSRLASARTVHALTDLQGTLQFRLPEAVAGRVAQLQQWAVGEMV